VTTQTPHHAYAMTGAMCLSAAAAIPGTVPAAVSRGDRSPDRVRIGHPKGTVSIGVKRTGEGDDVDIAWVSVGRHARLILDGRVYHRPLADLDYPQE